MKIVMLDRSGADFSYEKKAFRSEGAVFLVTYFQNADELRPIVRDADVLLVSDGVVSEAVIGTLERCKAIITLGANYENIDIEAAGARGIYVCNTPAPCAEDAAEYVMALLLAFTKRIPKGHTFAHTGKWGAEYVGHFPRLRGKTLGLIGYDDTARALEAMAQGFGMHTLSFDPFGDPAAGGVQFLSLLEESDFISLHMPLTEDTKHMMGMPQFRRMKKDAVLLSIGPGGLIDENELTFALLSGEIGGAALDAFETEPLPAGSRLFGMENVLITPHCAENTAEGARERSKESTENAIRVLHREIPLHVVNQPFLKGNLFV